MVSWLSHLCNGYSKNLERRSLYCDRALQAVFTMKIPTDTDNTTPFWWTNCPRDVTDVAAVKVTSYVTLSKPWQGSTFRVTCPVGQVRLKSHQSCMKWHLSALLDKFVIIFLIIDLSCRTSAIIIQPVRGAIFQNFCLSGMVGQSLRSSPAWLNQQVLSTS